MCLDLQLPGCSSRFPPPPPMPLSFMPRDDDDYLSSLPPSSSRGTNICSELMMWLAVMCYARNAPTGCRHLVFQHKEHSNGCFCFENKDQEKRGGKSPTIFFLQKKHRRHGCTILIAISVAPHRYFYQGVCSTQAKLRFLFLFAFLFLCRQCHFSSPPPPPPHSFMRGGGGATTQLLSTGPARGLGRVFRSKGTDSDLAAAV